ncbi:hypothetical protein ACB092_05G072800 [Castanea dentata]
MGFPMVLFLWVFGCFSASVIANEKRVGGLELHFYEHRCPNAEMTVKELTKTSMLTDPTTVASLLRTAFHDCQVDGCDASILLKDSPSSLTIEGWSEKNFGLRKFDLIHNIKSSLEEVRPYTSGAPFIEVSTRRRDSFSASKERADHLLPTANISVNEFVKFFQRHINISLEEAVALIGAHTLGIGHCRNFQERLRPVVDPTLSLQTIYSDPYLSDVAFALNDDSVFIFDSQYFIDIQNGRGLLKIDSEIARDPRTMPHVIRFGNDMQQFFNKFSSGFLTIAKCIFSDENICH